MGDARELEQVEVRPVVTAPSPEAQAAAKAWVAARAASRTPLAVGEVFTAGGHEFAVATCTPLSRGLVAPATTNVLLPPGPPIPALERVQLTYLSGIGDPEDQDHTLYQDYIRPQLLKWRDARQADNGHYFAVLVHEQVVTASEQEFGVRALDPDGRFGAIDGNTAVYISYIDSPALEKVHVLPYEDTLPAAYSYDLFRDFLQPFFRARPFAVYGEGDHLNFRGVRFRIMATRPASSRGRISCETLVYFEGEALRPTIWDLISPEAREDLRRLPRGLQVLLLNTMANEEAVQGRLTEVTEVLRRGQGLAASQLDSCGTATTWRAASRAQDTQTQCMVCLCDFAEGEAVRELRCEHVFHQQCVDEWLQRSAHCPICKRPASGAARPPAAAAAARRGGAASGAGARGSGDQAGAAEALTSSTGAHFLIGSRVSCGSGVLGTVVGLDEAAEHFRVSVDGSPKEERVPFARAVQLQEVRLTGLQSSAELNGRAAIVQCFDDGRGRYQVALLGEDRLLSVSPENCILSEGTVARVVGLRTAGVATRWNGHFGHVVGFDEPRARQVLSMHPRGQLLSVRARHLRL